MLVPLSDLSILSFLALLLPPIIGYGAPQPPRYEPPPPDRRSPEEKAFDKIIQQLTEKIERLIRLKETLLEQRKCESDLSWAVGNMEVLKKKLESLKRTVEELSGTDSSKT